jgi:SNF2 family DNA or RNA helicase
MALTSLDYSQSRFNYQGITLNEKFKSTLFKHQLDTVEWMLYREQIPFENIRGGLVLLEMGLGKTLCGLACAVLGGGATLVVVPAQLVYVWESEVKRHFDHTVSYFVYHGPNRKKKFERYRLKNGDPLLLIMSYQSISTDIEDEGGPLTNLDFFRIIFDECHYIKNQHTEVFRAVARIKGTVKWFFSGTPIMNRIQEMYPYLRLLNYRYIARIPQMARRRGTRYGHVYGGDDEQVQAGGYVDMQNLLRVIAIRRTKSILDLPKKTFQEVFVHMSQEEKLFYTILQDYSTKRIKKLMRNIKRVQGSGLTLGEQNRLRIIILQCMLSLIFHLRLCCCDPLLVVDKISRTKDMDLKRACRELMKDTTDTDCPVCFNNEATVVNQQCGHVACPDCWKRLSKMETMRCFTCMEATSLLQLRMLPGYEARKKAEIHDAQEKRIFHRSSKTRKVIDSIKEELEKGNKVVVVSQWTKYLDRLIHQFKCECGDVPYIYLNGKTLPSKRQLMVDDFQDDANKRVCFASLTSSAEGITLHAACSMVICDVYWNKARLEQISDRVHRIGQTKDVNIYCIYVANSIEMKLKDLIARKDIICKVVIDCAPITADVDSWLTRIIKLLD